MFALQFKQNTSIRNWARICVVLAFLRANSNHPLKRMIIPLLPQLLSFLPHYRHELATRFCLPARFQVESEQLALYEARMALYHHAHRNYMGEKQVVTVRSLEAKHHYDFEVENDEEHNEEEDADEDEAEAEAEDEEDGDEEEGEGEDEAEDGEEST
jgi:hypothetical protein